MRHEASASCRPLRADARDQAPASRVVGWRPVTAIDPGSVKPTPGDGFGPINWLLHYRFSTVAGVVLGRQVAKYDLARAFRPLD